MSIIGDPARRRHLLPAALQRTKIRYLLTEIFIDLYPGGRQKLWTFDFFVAICMFVIAYWIIIFIHYIFQYAFLLQLSIPTYGFHAEFYQITFKYSSASIPLSHEVGIVIVGPVSNLITFIILGTLSALFEMMHPLPDAIANFIAYFGVLTVLDPINIFILNLMSMKFHCGYTSEICHVDYTSPDCKCFTGDAFKLYERLYIQEGSGATGNVLLGVLYVGYMVIAAFFVYEYLLLFHHNGEGQHIL